MPKFYNCILCPIACKYFNISSFLAYTWYTILKICSSHFYRLYFCPFFKRFYLTRPRSQGCQVIMWKIRENVWKAIRRRLKNPQVGNMGIKIKEETSPVKNFFKIFSLNIRNLIFFNFFWHFYRKIKIRKHKIIHHTNARIRPYLYTSAPHLWSSTMEFMDC